LKRIPHSEEAISDIDAVQQYTRKNRRDAERRYGPFFNILNRLNIKGTALEIGSGPGVLAAMIARKMPELEITALELSNSMIDRAKETIVDEGLSERVRFIEGSADDRVIIENLGKFDLVYSTFSLHHWIDPETTLGNLIDAMKDNGVLLLFDLKRVSWLYHIPVRNGFFDSIRASYRPREIEVMLWKNNIENFQIQTPFPFFWHCILVRK